MNNKAKELGSESVQLFAKEYLKEDFNVGLTKREYFAALAMLGLLIRSMIDEKKIAEFAVSQADALLEELSKNVHNE